MTKEEAANILSNDIIDGHVEGNARFMDAFWFAVDNLKSEPCEDAVSRADTLQSFESYCEKNCQYSKKQRDVMCGACMMGDAIEIVENLPPVTPKPKTGHWITKEAYSEDKAMGFTKQIVCSNCDMQNSYFSEWDECKNPISKTFIRSKFCPNCGAKMVESEE